MTENISNKAVVKATEKSWDAWHKVLKRAKVDDLTHKEIVTYLREKHGLTHWWAQTITVDYEQYIGRRKEGQTQSADFQIGVRKTLNFPSSDVWDLLMSPKGSQLWLGKNRLKNFDEGKKYSTSEGTTGEFRVNKPYHHIRLTWKLKDWERPSVLQVRVIPVSSKKSTISFHQEKLKNQKVREQMRAHWKEVLKKISELESSG
jgi:uncharacterized protein YndB with AHSA1/START domain